MGVLRNKYCRIKSSPEHNFFNYEIWPFVVTTEEGGKVYGLGQEFLLAQKVCISSDGLKEEADIPEKGRGNEFEG